MFNRTYYLEDEHFRDVLKEYIKDKKRIAVGYDGALKMYYITLL